MNYKFFILMILFSQILQGQSVLKQANTAYQKKEFVSAIDLYTKTLNQEKKVFEKQKIHFNMGNCYYYLHDYNNALKYYEFSFGEGNNDPEIYLRLSDALIHKSEYDDAKILLKKYLKKRPEDAYARILIQKCEFAKKFNSPVPNFVTINLKDLNTHFAEYGLTAFNDHIIFSSSRIENDSFRIYKVTGQAYSDFYITNYLNTKNSWSVPEKINGAINTPFNEGSSAYDPNSNTLYFMQCNGLSGKEKNCYIYYARYNDATNKWSKPEIFPVGNDEFNYGHPAITSDGNTIYFVSDMTGGEGGKDIWYIKKKEDQTWTNPVNAGIHVNTIGDELFPYVYKDSILYFASDGHEGYGGLDIFSIILKDIHKSIPKNMGLPINSSFDDFNILFFDRDSGLLCSNRPGGEGDDDIYSFYNIKLKLNIDGFIKDRLNNKFISDVMVFLLDDKGVIDSTHTNENGYYFFQNIENNQHYAISVHKAGYLDEMKFIKPNLSNKNGKTIHISKVHFSMISITENEIKLNNIYYDFGKWTLTEESKSELDRLVNILKVNPEINIQINSHTDDIGDEEFNNELSDYRAQSVVKYLIENRIDPLRLTYRGWGESKPFIENAKTEEERKLNRRTTFQILNPEEIITSFNSEKYLKLTDSILIEKESGKESTEQFKKEKKEVVFRLQVYVGPKKIPKSLYTQIIQIIGRYEIIVIKGKDKYYRYAVGDFNKFDQAIEMQKRLNEYNIESTVTAFLNNLRITILEARQLSEEYENF